MIAPVFLLAERQQYGGDLNLVEVKAFKTARKLAEKIGTKSRSIELAAELRTVVYLKFRVGARFTASKAALTGIVVGSRKQKTSCRCVRVHDEKTVLAKPRAASTPRILNFET